MSLRPIVLFLLFWMGMFFTGEGNILYAVADVSCIVVDLKYNAFQGVKICEIQPASFSRFSGADALEGSQIVCQRYCDLLAQYGLKGYFTHPLYQGMKKTFIERGWKAVRFPEEIVVPLSNQPRGSPDDLSSYQTCLFCLSPDLVLQWNSIRFPHVLFLDRAVLPYARNKYLMNKLLDQIKSVKQLRPVWKVYRKGTSKELMDQIVSEIPGDMIVIKPIESTMGRGVIILEKKDLESILLYIFGSSKELLVEDMDRSYSHYAVDASDGFIVEEFIPSDFLYLGDFLQPYDCTMRMVLVLSYDRKVPQIDCLSKYWYSPRHPVGPEYTPTESRKAKGTYFSQVDPIISEEVERQLYPALLDVYQAMLKRL